MAHKIEQIKVENTSLGMDEISVLNLNQKMAQWFMRFSEQAEGSPMYQHLSTLIANDQELLVLAGQADSKQPAPNLFFAAVHFLLITNPDESLAKFYPSLGGQFLPSSEMFSCFKKFCEKYKVEIRKILVTKLVQTNEVQRCALLFPALNLVFHNAKKHNIALIDVGASGGLNFLMDKAHIEYSDGTTSGPQSSVLKISCESIGEKLPSVQPAKISRRIGIDLNPVNLLNETERNWNYALVWPDQLKRLERVKTALELLSETPIDFFSGDGNKILPKIISEFNQNQALCIMHSFTLNQFSKEDRESFDNILAKASSHRDLYRISLEWIGTKNPELSIMYYDRGAKQSTQKIAECHGHGEWIRWSKENEVIHV